MIIAKLPNSWKKISASVVQTKSLEDIVDEKYNDKATNDDTIYIEKELIIGKKFVGQY